MRLPNSIRLPIMAEQHGAMRTLFESGTTRSIEWRTTQLNALLRLLEEDGKSLYPAMLSDLGKTESEAYLTEVAIVKSEATKYLGELSAHMEPEAVPSPGVTMPCYSYIRKEPRGVVLIIGPFNYPCNLLLGPLASALACGNCAVLKPSELTPAVSAWAAKTIPKHFPADVVSVQEGGVKDTTALLKLSWDLVFFTGSERVGKIVAEAAAKTLSPVVLELGGKSPVVVDESAPELTSMCNRLAWGKTLNCGQTCVAPDYMLCHDSQVGSVAKGLVSSLQGMYGDTPQQCKDYPRIVTPQHATRLVDMMKEAEDAGCVPICGGSKLCDASQRFVAPTIFVDPPPHLRILQEEIFGPILSIRRFKKESEAISTIKAMPGTPLALYVFTTNQAMCDRVLDACPSGGAAMNDVVLHFANGYLPFGGLGTSGFGSAHGKYGLRAFSHERAFLSKPCHPAFEFGNIRYAPFDKYGGYSGKAFAVLLELLPDTPVLRTRRLMAGVGLTALAFGALAANHNSAGTAAFFSLRGLAASGVTQLAAGARHGAGLLESLATVLRTQ